MKKNKKLKIYAGLILLSAAFFVAMTPYRSYFGLNISASIQFAGYFLLTYFFIRKYKDKIRPSVILLLMMSGFSLIDIPMRIYQFNDMRISLPMYLFSLLGCFAGYLFYKSDKVFKVVVVVFSVAGCLFMYFVFHEMWLNKINSGTLTGRITPTEVRYDLRMLTPEGDTLALSRFEGETLVLDFWTTHCGVCFKKFPKFESLYLKYKDYPSIRFYAVHCFDDIKKYSKYFGGDDETYSTGAAILQDRGFGFPSLSVPISDTVLKELGVKSFPQTLIFDMDNRLIFRGDVNLSEKVIRKQVMR